MLYSAVELSSSVDKSGRQSVCHGEIVVYNCQSTTGGLLWDIKPLNGWLISHIFGDSDSDQFLNEGEYLLSLQITHTAAMSTLSSLLIIPYTSNWAGTEILCADNTGNKTRLYIIAGTYQHDWYDYPHKFNSCSCPTVSRPVADVFLVSMLHINKSYRIQPEIFVQRKISPFFCPLLSWLKILCQIFVPC